MKYPNTNTLKLVCLSLLNILAEKHGKGEPMGMIEYELPYKIEDYLDTLSVMYATNGKTEIAEILKDPEYTIDESYDTVYDSDGSHFGHKINLKVGKSVFPMNIDLKCKIEEDIRKDLNRLHKSKYEYIAEVNLEMIRRNNPDRQKQPVLLTPNDPEFPADEVESIWGKNGFRVFISYKTQPEVKAVIKELKDQLMVFGISCFLAHENIQVSAEWELEIEKALFSMDALLAFMTESFHESEWTDQELGVALARRVQIIPINHGRKPYGFIGKYQAITYKEDLAIEIAKTFLQKKESKNKMVDSYIRAVKNCPHYNPGNELAKLLPEIKKLDEKRILELISAYNENKWIKMSYGFNGKNSRFHGDGLLHYIFQWTGKKYMFNSAGKITPIQ